MANEPDWNLLEYTTDSGRTPVQDFLESLTGRDLDDALALLGRLRQEGNRLRRPTSGALDEGLFELRGRRVRIFYVFLPGRRLVLLDGMVKKRGDIPADVLRRVRRYQREMGKTEE